MTIRTPDLADIIVRGISDGTPLRQLCRENGISKSWVYEWVKEDETLAGRIARARDEGFDNIAEQTLEIADSDLADAVAVQHAKLRIETRLKLLAKWDPRRYGDKVALTGGGDGDAPIRTESKLDVGGLTDEQLRVLASIRVEK